MDKNTIKKLTGSFDAIAQYIPDGATEFWYARDLQELLGYTEWQNFLKVIEKAKDSAQNVGASVQNHFVDVNKMVSIGSGAERPVEDIMLTRQRRMMRNPMKCEVGRVKGSYKREVRRGKIFKLHTSNFYWGDSAMKARTLTGIQMQGGAQ